jgi:hypothetical protein
VGAIKSGYKVMFTSSFFFARFHLPAGIGKRLQNDWKATKGKPYIKQTSTLRFDVYSSCDDEEPIDSFCTESVKAYSLKTLALVGLGAAVLACTAKCILKKMWK